MLRRWLLLSLCLLLLLNCGEPVPVDCTPDEEQCTTETEGGFETGTVAGVAAGGAAVIALAGGAGLGGGDGGGSSGGASSNNSNTDTNSSPATRVGVLLDSVVEGVSYSTTSGASGTTNQSGEFPYKDGDKVTFTLGGVELGQVDGAAVLTPVELAGANDTADRRVINLSRFLQSLDDDGDPENGLSISSSARTALEGRSLNFNLPVSTFAISASVAVQSATGRSLVSASQAINHLHGTLGNRGLVDLVADTEEIQQVVPEFVVDSTLSEAISANPELCQFNETLLSSGQSIIAYQSESVAFGQSCTSQTRTCNSGTLSGSYTASSCKVRTASDCSLNGQPVAHGADVTAYSSETVDFGDTCSSQLRTCSNGTLSGSYIASTCRVASAATCSFAGETIEHGTSVTAFSASSVAAGGNCLAELRSCENGVLSGSYTFGSCVVENEEVKSSCTFDGKLINHGSIVTAYSSSSVPYGSTCTAQLRTCNDGILSGSYTASVCNVADALSCSFNSSNVAHGTNVTAYKTASVDYGSTCVSEQRTCSNGNLTGSYSYSSCQPSAAAFCSFNGQTVAHGTNVTAYEDDEVNFGVSCRVQERTCNNGNLTGSYQYGTCTVAAAATCTFDGQTVAHGTNVTAYKDESVSFGSSCVSQQRTCSNGILTGSYTNPSCSVEGASSCTFNGETIESGNSVTAYKSSTVAYGSTCTNQSRTCTNGSLSGSYVFESCSVSPPATCSFNGQTVAHDGVVTAYADSSVDFGSDCQSEVRACSNGVLGGSFVHSTCVVEEADSCTFNEQTVTHGNSVTAYLSESVAYGGSCSSQTRTCSDGTLSGNYEYETCSVQAAANCTFNGQAVAHGSSVTAYLADSVAYGGSCSSQTRTCSDGTLSGGYAYNSCLIQPKIKIPESGQTYDATSVFGEDSDYSINTVSFEQTNGAVLDLNTNLWWLETVDVYKTYNINESIEYCQSLTVNGMIDWRVPEIYELVTIVDYDSPYWDLYSGYKSLLFDPPINNGGFN